MFRFRKDVGIFAGENEKRAFGVGISMQNKTAVKKEGQRNTRTCCKIFITLSLP
jgi:hypothetical protein